MGLGKTEKKRRYLASAYAVFGAGVPAPGQWRAQVGLPESAPIFLEIGCGKGEFAVQLAQQHPEALVVGLDRRADRLATGCRLAAEAHLNNVLFWHGDALVLEAAFMPGEVSEIWLNYPDPYPKARHAKHRLVHPRFLRLYRTTLRPGGSLHMRTDAPGLYFYALAQLSENGWCISFSTPDLQPGEAPELAFFETEFRRRKGGPIHYIHARQGAAHADSF